MLCQCSTAAQEVADYLGFFMQALASCHKGGIFHGDVKPHNVKARHWSSDEETENVQATLLDFGAGCLFKGKLSALRALHHF